MSAALAAANGSFGPYCQLCIVEYDDRIVAALDDYAAVAWSMPVVAAVVVIDATVKADVDSTGGVTAADDAVVEGAVCAVVVAAVVEI